MPFIERQDRTERQELKVKIRPEVIALVKEYAEFTGNDDWFVVQEVLRKAILSDREFRPPAQKSAESGTRGKRKKGKPPAEVKAVA